MDAGRYTLDWIKPFYDRTAVWWGPNTSTAVYQERVRTVERLAGPPPRRVLDLGAGPGGTAAALADAGYDVVAVELSDRAAYARKLAAVKRAGSMEVVQADFYSAELPGRFDVVCCFEVFGLGNDADQRRLLRRIAEDWLAPGGAVLMDVYSPFKPARDDGTEELLKPLRGVPGSVEMRERCRFDPFHSRWIDEWVPAAAPERSLAQTLRCYSPVDLLLVLEGTGLSVDHLVVEGEALALPDGTVRPSAPLLEAWSYLVRLRPTD